MATVNWGDGATSPGTVVALSGGNYRVDAPAHSYAEEATYTVNVTLTHDLLAALTTPNQTIVIADRQLTNLASANLPSSGQENVAVGAITGIATFTDPAGPEALGDYTATVNWGDGTTSPGSIVALSGNNFRVDAPTHTYTEEATYTVTVGLNHAALATVTTPAQTIVVADQQLTSLASANLPSSGHQNIAIGAITGIATFTDPAGPEALTDYMATVNWGDGTTSPGTIVALSGNNFRVDAPTHTYTQQATYTVTVSLKHDALATVTTPAQTIVITWDVIWNGPTATWTMNPVPNPTIAQPSSQTNTEADVVNLAISASDPSGYALTYDAVNLPTGLSINASTGVISGTVDNSAAENFGGAYDTTVIASDSQGGSASTEFPWTIIDLPRAPVLTNPGDQTNSAGDTVSLQVAASDPDGNQLSYDAIGLPSGLSIDAASGLISGTIDPSAGAATPYTVTVTVDDGTNSVSQNLNWTVSAVNAAPSLAGPGNQIDALGDQVSLALSATDADGDVLTYTATGLPAGLSIDPGSGMISGTVASSDASGSPYSVTATVSDGSLYSSQSFSWTIFHTGITNPGPQYSVAGDVVSLQVAATSVGSTLTYSATGLPSGLSLNTSTGLISGTLGATTDTTSPYSVSVTAYGGGDAATAAFTWTIADMSLANPGNQSGREGWSASLQLAAVDADGDALTYSATGLPAGVSLNAANGQVMGAPGAAAHLGSPYQVTFTVSDGGHSVSQSLMWTVTPEIAIANPGAQASAAGDTVSLQVQATDSTPGTLSFSATGLPSGLSINSSTGLISGTIPTTAASSYTVIVTVSDGMFSNSQVFLWTTAPLVLPTLADQSNLDGDSVSLSAAAHYHGSGSLTYSATGLPTGLTIDAATGLISGTVGNSADAGGPYSVTVTVTDGTTTATQTFNWTIDPVVTVTSLDDQVGVASDAVSVAVSATDALSNALTYSASGLPSGLSIDAATGLISGTIALTAASSTPYAVTVTAQDAVFSASTTFNWTVSPLSLANPGPRYNVDGQAVSLALAVDENDGDTLTFSATNLPPGLSINASTGVISGNLSATADQGSGYLTTETVSDGTNSATEDFQWNVSKIGAVNPGAQTSQEGDTVSLTIQTAGISGTPAFSASGLPAGLSIDASTGVIAGTIEPGATGSFTVVVAVSNGTLASQQSFTWTVTPVITVATIADQSNNEGDAVSIQPSATDANNATVTWSASGLPAGLSIDAGTGAITGTLSYGDANAGPDYAVTVTAGDGTYSGSQTFNLHVASSFNIAPTLTNPGAQGNQAGDNVDFFLAASDSNGDALTFSETGLPDGLSLDSNTGEISGTVADDAVSSTPYAIVATVDNGQGGTATQTFSWIINAPALTAASGPGTISATEGQDTGSLTVATFSTPDLSSLSADFTATVTWGDGTSDQGAVDGSNGTFTVTDDHVFADQGNYAVSVSIAGANGSYGTVTGSASVADAALTLTGGFTLGAIVDNQATLTVTTLTDGNPGSSSADFSATINWGDNTTPSNVTLADAVDGLYQVSGQHTYTADGTYSVSVQVTGADGATTSTASSVVVGDIWAGVPSTLTLASFKDANPNATTANFAATVNWGDGTSSAGTIGNSGSAFAVGATHIYATDSAAQSGGVYQVVTVVADSDGNALTYTKTVGVADPTVTIVTSNLITDASGALTNAVLGTFTDPNLSNTPSAFSVSIKWTSGSASSGAISNSNGCSSVLGSHSYGASGIYNGNILLSYHGHLVAVKADQITAIQGEKPSTSGPFVVPGLSRYTYTVLNPGNGQVTWENFSPDFAKVASFVSKNGNTAVVEFKNTQAIHGNIVAKINGQAVTLGIVVVKVTVSSPDINSVLAREQGATYLRFKANNGGTFIANKLFSSPGQADFKYENMVQTQQYARVASGLRNATDYGLVEWAAVKLEGPTIGKATNWGIGNIQVGFIQTATATKLRGYYQVPNVYLKHNFEGRADLLDGAAIQRTRALPEWLPWYPGGRTYSGFPGLGNEGIISLDDSPRFAFPDSYLNANKPLTSIQVQVNFKDDIVAMSRRTGKSPQGTYPDPNNKNIFARLATANWSYNGNGDIKNGTEWVPSRDAKISLPNTWTPVSKVSLEPAAVTEGKVMFNDQFTDPQPLETVKG
jgi:hypothetical protein